MKTVAKMADVKQSLIKWQEKREFFRKKTARWNARDEAPSVIPRKPFTYTCILFGVVYVHIVSLIAMHSYTIEWLFFFGGWIGALCSSHMGKIASTF